LPQSSVGIAVDVRPFREPNGGIGSRLEFYFRNIHLSSSSTHAAVPINQLRAAPNQLTFLRLCLVPFLLLAVLEKHFELAFGLFVIAGLSDALDGLLARWLKQSTTLGMYLDPVADKLLLSSLFLTLHHVGLVSRRVTLLVFARDFGILVVGAILFAAAGLRNFRPSIFGKANTLAQIIAVVAVMLAQFEPLAAVHWVERWSLVATGVLACVSGFDYALKMTRRLSLPAQETPVPARPPATASAEAEMPTEAAPLSRR
jgi:cardiolipin synthase